MDKATIITLSERQKTAAAKTREENKSLGPEKKVHVYESPFALALQRATEKIERIG